jgi:hypothetical protein
LKSMPTDEERERAAVYMDGLSQMRSDWAPSKKRHASKGRRGNVFESSPERLIFCWSPPQLFAGLTVEATPEHFDRPTAC